MQRRVEHRRQRFRRLGLADARLTLEQQRLRQAQAEEQRRREALVDEIVDVRESSSRPDRGVVTVETRGFNQRGEEVCFFRRKVMVYKRDALPPRQRPYETPSS